MKHISIIFLGIFFFGFLIGGSRWIIEAQVVRPEVLSKLRGPALRAAITFMVQRQPFPLVIAEVKRAFPREEQWMHDAIGHTLGESAYRRYGMKAFVMCDPFFNEGCYHGVVEIIARINGPDKSLLPKLKSACELHVDNYRICTHPLGHAAAVLYNYDVAAALAACDSFYPASDVAAPCWMGVIMEYNDRTAQIASARGIIPKDDAYIPYAPCSTYPSKYEGVCAKLAMSYFAQTWHNDFPRLLAYCTSYGHLETVHDCVDELGYIIAQEYPTMPSKAITLCNSFAGLTDSCVHGLVRTYKTTNDFDAARQACAALNDAQERQDCLSS